MNARKYLGMSFTWDRLALLPASAKKSWPVTVPVLLVVIHYFAVTRFGFAPETLATIKKWGPVVLQIVGGLIVVYSIDSNMGLFGRDSLMARVINFFKDLPIFCWTQTVSVDSTFSWSSVGTPILRAKIGDDTLEGRVQQLEADLRLVQQELNVAVANLRKDMQTATEKLDRKLQDLQETISRLESGLKQMTRDGVGLQVFGVILAIYGTIFGALP